MTIGYIGNFSVPFTTENDIKWSLEQLGVIVIPYQENTTARETILSDVTSEKIDLLLYTSTHGWETPTNRPWLTMEWLLSECESRHIPTVGIHLDLWNGLDRARDVGERPFWKCKYIFTADGGSEDFFKQKGITHFWLKPGVVKRDCYLGNFRPEFDFDVGFVGSGDYTHRQWRYRKELLTWLETEYGNRFVHIGRPNRVLRGPDLNDLYASVKIIVGDSLCIGFNHPYYWSDRIYETLGRGGFLIHPFIKGLTDEFTPGVDLEFYNYGDFDRLKYLIEFYLRHYIQRRHIQLTGHELVRNSATYTDRMKELLFTVAEHEPVFKESLLHA